MSLSDHVFYPDKLDSSYPYTDDGRPMFPPETPWPDVWVMTGAMAAVTDRHPLLHPRLRAAGRNPFVVAKAVGTAAYLSGGRVLLGVGAGWMREEFTQLGQPFARRSARMEEQIAMLRTLWRAAWSSTTASSTTSTAEMSPAPPAPVPVLIGGHTERRPAPGGPHG